MSEIDLFMERLAKDCSARIKVADALRHECGIEISREMVLLEEFNVSLRPVLEAGQNMSNILQEQIKAIKTEKIQ